MTFLTGAFLANHVSAALGSGGEGNQGKVNTQNQSGAAPRAGGMVIGGTP